MIYFVRFSTGLYAGYDLELVISCSNLKDLENYLDDKFYEYMSDYEYLAYNEWIDEQEEEEVSPDDFYESEEYLSYIENGSTFFKKITQEEYDENYNLYEIVELD
jgi:hypothetical protein